MRAFPRVFLLLACLPLGIALSALAADPETPRSRGEAKDMWAEDGLTKASIKGIDVAFVRPGASLAPYKSVLVAPVAVSLRSDWKKSGGMHGVRARPEDIERIRSRVGELVREEFLKELESTGVALSQSPGEDVLEVRLAVKDLYASAPDLNQLSARSQVYSVSAGSMTLVGDLGDSVSGETLLRFYDHGAAREFSSGPRRIEFGENEIEARKIARQWAQALHAGLQAARAGK